MNDLEGNVANSRVHDNIEDRIRKEKVAAVSHWHEMAGATVATVTASCTSWLQLADTAMVLNCMDVRMSPADKLLLRQKTLQRLMETDSSCHDLTRLSTKSFNQLCQKLQETGLLSTYRHPSTEEQVATFLMMIGQKFTNRAISFVMCRSGETISRYFHNVLRALISLDEELLVQPAGDYHSDFIYQNRRFFPYFKDCIGALDGTHVRVKVPRLDASRYRGRKEFPTQNVLAACTFDLRFTYVLAGWEGSASDSRVLKSALTREDPLVIPNGKYYLGDAGFGLTTKILVPYGKTRYHLKEYAVRGPQNPQELFNLRHSSLRNSIERCFGIIKNRFPIIGSGAECRYSCETMTHIVLACCILHNFLREVEGVDCVGEHEGAQNSQVYGGDASETVVWEEEGAGAEYERGKILRDQIAQQMWEQYQAQSNVIRNSTTD